MPEPELLAAVAQIFDDALGVPAPDPSTDIVEAGLLDSLMLVTLLFEIEQGLDVRIPFESLEIDDFRSLKRIATLVERARVEAAA